MSDLCSKGSESDASSDSSWTLLAEEKTSYGQTQTDPYTDDELEELEAPECDPETTTSNIEEVYVNYKSGEESISEGAVTEEDCEPAPTAEFVVAPEGQELQLVADKWESIVERRLKRKDRKRRVDTGGIMLVAGAFLGLLSIAFACLVLPRSPSTSFEPRKYYKNTYPEIVQGPELPRNADVFMSKTRRHFESPRPKPDVGKRAPLCPAKLPKKAEPGLLGQLLGAGRKISDKFYRYAYGERKDGSSSSSGGFFFKTNIYLALHILNDLVLLKATSRLRKDVELKIRMLKKRTQVKRGRKLLRLHKLNPDAIVPRRLLEAARKRRASKDYFDFLHEMQQMRDRKRELLKSLNLKARKQHKKEEKEARRLDKAYLASTYDKVTSDATLKEQLMFCLSYLHARKRDFSTLISKMELSDIIVQSPKYQAFLDKLVRLEDEIVKYFQIKSNFVECGGASSRPNCEIGTVIDFLLARQNVAKARLAQKDACTERYNVPIESKTNIKPDDGGKLEWPISTIVLDKEAPSYPLVPVETEKKLSKEKLEVLKSWKDKYEQLKLFWKSRQEYYDKRVEICKMIKKIIPPEQGDEGGKKAVVDTSADLIDNVLNDIKMVFKQSNTKTDVNGSTAKPVNLYQKLFERKAQQIQKIDERKWQVAKYPKLGEEQPLSKHDPSRTQRERVVRK